VAVIIPTDIVKGSWEALKFLFGLLLGRKRFDYAAGTGVGWKERHKHEEEQGLTTEAKHVAKERYFEV
jgi:hypothetical protein